MQVYLVGSSQMGSGVQEFLRDQGLTWSEGEGTPEAQRIIEFSGRICYMAFGRRQSPRTNNEYIENLISQGHGSVLEHSSASVLFADISRGLSHQLVRHRAGFSYSQLSQQYVSGEDASFVIPSGIRGDPNLERMWSAVVEKSRDAYIKIAETLEKSAIAQHLSQKERSRFIRSAARSVLPEATHTSLIVTGNMRAWRNLLTARGYIPGDYEMMEACVGALRLLQGVAPACFSDMSILTLPDGQEYLSSKAT